MSKNDIDYTSFMKILGEEFPPAVGCTEPIAVTHCVATAKRTLEAVPDHVVVEANGNIIRNVKSVAVPNTGYLHGIPAATATGIAVDNAGKRLEVITSVTKEEQKSIRVFMEQVPIAANITSSPLIPDIAATIYAGGSYVKVCIANYHTNIVLVEKDGEVLQFSEVEDDGRSDMTDRPCLSVEKIYDFANTVDVEDIKKLLGIQITCNMDISRKGLKNDYGADAGSVLLKASREVMDSCNESAPHLEARAMATAGSDAHMNGCELSVVIDSGSGNQGITASVPAIVYARTMGVGERKLYRALVLSNLLGIHQKTPIGRLSAYCDAINTGTAVGYGTAHPKSADLDGTIHALVNILAIASGVVCDGAKTSYVDKVALAADNGVLGYEMYQEGQQFVGGGGIVKKSVESMIVSVERLGRDGTAETDKETLRVMVSD